MAAVSPQSLPIASPLQHSPSLKGIKKVLSSRRSSEAQSDSGTPVLHPSADLPELEKSPSLQSTRSLSRDDGGNNSPSSGVRKLIPGHAKRQRQRIREEELKIALEEEERGRQPGPEKVPPLSSDLNRSASTLFTDESEADSPPPLTSRDSHAAYLTTSSPLIRTSTVENSGDPQKSNMTSNLPNISVEQFPLIVEPESDPTETSVESLSPRSPAMSSTSALPSPGLIDKADTLRPEHKVERRSSFSKLRGKSPARKFRDVFSKGAKSPRTSPERRDGRLPSPDPHDLMRASTSMGERRHTENPDKRGPSPLRAQTLAVGPSIDAPRSAAPVLETNAAPPRTPPSGIIDAPLTTVTPPTPTDTNRRTAPDSPIPDIEARGSGDESTGTVSSQNEGSMTHRRVRSTSSATHTKSKLSTSMTAPLTPTIEEMKTPTPGEKPVGTRNITPGGGFFSSWVSAAQNAASTITSLTNQNNRGRAGTGSSDLTQTKGVEETEKEQLKSLPPDTPKKQLAVETMGTGNLNLAHLGIGANGDSQSPNQAVSGLRKTDPALGTDEAAAKMEDILARRAVSQAYEKPAKSGDATPVAEVPDPITGVKSSQTFDTGSGTLTPPNGSIFEEEGGVKRSNSVRSKLANRRSRGSSVTTGQSTISAMVGASTVTLATPATGPKLSGFAIAPKQRNRAFHQQFRSVPEDDYLVEDYSCALQKEILLAGRLYISEGHICFSSNILGWVTTLIISFEEVVSIEKENTAIVIPNAIAVQTLHARHTFRSLLSREATYDLMIGIWKVSHPDSFQKSMNSKQLTTEAIKQEEVPVENGHVEEQDSDSGSGEGSDADEDDGSAPSVANSSVSLLGSDIVEAKSITRKASGGNGIGAPVITAAPGAPSGDATAAVAPTVGSADGVQDFPGPATHAPTECTDKATHYDKIIKDEIIPAPLGKVYSLLFGAQSGVFMRKFLEEGVSKAQDLQMEDDKKGLTNDSKVKQYKYIKPLGGSIGPKQTSCITTETLDFLDLDKAVSVTCTTQTPDVPSGSAFSTKTRYCITWAPGNATRFQMNMTIEWTAKSWLKGPIEKGALDGQTQYGDDVVKTLKGALGRNRALTSGSGSKNKVKKKRKGGKKEKSDEVKAEAKTEENWGLFEPLKPLLGPFADIVKPMAQMNVIVGLLSLMVIWMWFRGAGSARQVGFPWDSSSQRLIAYEQLWQQEENNLWDWLEDRAGVDSAFLRESLDSKKGKHKPSSRARSLWAKEVGNTGMKEMQHAVRVTQERLNAMQEMLDRQKLAADQN